MLGLLLAGCGNSETKPPKMSEVFPNLPLPPQAEFVSRSGGKDALQVTVRSPFKVEQVAKYYREVLKSGSWQLVNEARDADGAVVLFAKQKGPPLWVRIRSTEDSTGALVELSGALTAAARDSAKAQAPRKS